MAPLLLTICLIESIAGSVNATYSHDANGNVITDNRKNLQIRYNLLNLTQNVSEQGVKKASYTWIADGTKAATKEENSSSQEGLSYLGSMVYSLSQGSYTLESVAFGEGVVFHQTGIYSPYYYTTDHLGSIRVMTDPAGSVVEQNDYYPFGERTEMGAQYPMLDKNRYKYNGKEEQTIANIGYLDYGTRFYDPTITRWLGVDPLCREILFYLTLCLLHQ